VEGRATLEIGPDENVITTLSAGDFIPEDLLAHYGAHLRASIPCEAYRVRHSDFAVIVRSVPSVEWFCRFRLLEKQMKDRLRDRLHSTRGLIDGTTPHPSKDREIRAWRNWRSQAAVRANQLKVEKAWPGPHPHPSLPRVSSAGSVGSNSPSAAPDLKGINAYPLLPKLPMHQGGAFFVRSAKRSTSQPHLLELAASRKGFPRPMCSSYT